MYVRVYDTNVVVMTAISLILTVSTNTSHVFGQNQTKYKVKYQRKLKEYQTG